MAPVIDTSPGPADHPRFDMWTEQTPACPLVHLRGDLEGSNAEAMYEQVMAAAALTTPPTVVVDFNEVKRCDCSGLGATMVIWEHLRAAGGLLVLTGLSKFLHALFTSLAPDRNLAISDTIDQAIERAKRGILLTADLRPEQTRQTASRARTSAQSPGDRHTLVLSADAATRSRTISSLRWPGCARRTTVPAPPARPSSRESAVPDGS